MGKIKNFVNFPITNLNLQDFIKSPQKNVPTYDLFAISVKNFLLKRKIKL